MKSSAILLLLPAAALADVACCSWNSCGVCGDTTDYCKSGQNACEDDCGGQWCPDGAAGASGYDIKSICDTSATGEKTYAYACIDWSAGSKAMMDAAESEGLSKKYVFGVGSFGSGSDNMGKCYDIEIEGQSIHGLFQVLNQGGDVTSNQFDLQLGDGGLGLFNGCVSSTGSGGAGMYGDNSANFGPTYGGWQAKADCSKLPTWPDALTSPPEGELNLQELCEKGFEIGVRIDGGKNPVIKSATRVACPDSLVKLTGLRRSDEKETETHTGDGMLTRMMDCCKPSAGWIGNVDSVDTAYPAVIPCTSDGYTRVSVSMRTDLVIDNFAKDVLSKPTLRGGLVI